MKKVKDDKRHPNQNQAGSREEKCKVSGEVHVRGEVEVNFPKTFIDEYIPTKKENSNQEHKHYRLAIITLIVGIAYAALTLWLALSSQQSATAATNASKAAIASYEATSRPYLFGKVNTEITDNPANMVVVSTIKNYGSIPTDDIQFQWKVFIEGLWLTVNEPGQATTVLEPTDSMITKFSVGTKDSIPIMKAEQPLRVYLSYSYGWRDKQEHGCQEFAYAAQAKAFMTTGNTCNIP